MPEGPSILILGEQAAKFAGKTVRRVEGNSKLDLGRMQGRRVRAVRTWGKHFLLQFAGFALRVHLLMFGSYRIDERRPDKAARVSLGFDDGELNFYNCSLKYIEGDLDDAYDWSGDVLSEHWDPKKARRKLKAQPDMLACDALLDQAIFAGVGNIIKNEALFRIHVQPLSRIGALPPRKLGDLVREARGYSLDFLAWKRQFVLRKHLLVHDKGVCSRCAVKLRRAHLGRYKRRSFWCENCQVLYGANGA